MGLHFLWGVLNAAYCLKLTPMANVMAPWFKPSDQGGCLVFNPEPTMGTAEDDCTFCNLLLPFDQTNKPIVIHRNSQN